MTATRTIAGAAIPVAIGLLTACSSGAMPAVSTSPPAVPATTPAAPATIGEWCGGTGYEAWQAVSTDADQLRTDSADGDTAAVSADGDQLASAAGAAGANLPPFARAHRLDYGLAMGWLTIAGSKTASGDISGATSALQKANSYLGDVGALVASACPGG